MQPSSLPSAGVARATNLVAWAAVLSGSLSLSACDGDEPVWDGPSCESARFVYHVRDVDADLCPAQLSTLEEHADVLTSALELDADVWAKAQYFKYADADDLRAADECGPSDACTFRPDVYTTRALDEHELIHIYTDRKWIPNLLSEGAAEALTCRSLDSAGPCSEDWREILNVVHDRQVYDCGARFAYRLLTRGSAAKLTALERRIAGDESAEAFEQGVRDEYGVEVDDIWQTEVLTDKRQCVPFFACAGEILGSGRTELDDAAQHRLRLPAEAGRLVRISYRDTGAPGEVELARCEATALPDPDDRWRVSESSAPEVWIETNGADYALDLFTGAVDIDVAEDGFDESCSAEPGYELALDRSTTFLLRRDGRTLFFPLKLDRSRPVDIAVNVLDMVADARWCASCEAAAMSDCTELLPAPSLTVQRELDDGVLVVTTSTGAGQSGRLTLRPRRDALDP